MHFNVTRALSSDAADLADLLSQALPPGWPAGDIAASCGDANRAVLKAVDRDAVAGFAVLQFAADEAEILSIAVAKEARRRGIASSMMEAAIGICRQKSIASVFLEVAEGNGGAIGLYEKFGFCKIARRENYYQAARAVPETALIMRLDMERGAAQIDRHINRTL